MSKKIYALGNSKVSQEELIDVKKRHKEKMDDLAKEKLQATKDFTPEATDAYNADLISTLDPRLEGLTLPKGKLLIRLFRAPRIVGNIYLPNTKTYISENSGALKIESTDDSSNKYISRAVIVKAAPDLEDQYAPGTVIDLYMQSYKNIAQFWSPLSRDMESVEVSKNPENYFTVPESVVNFIWNNTVSQDLKEKPSKLTKKD